MHRFIICFALYYILSLLSDHYIEGMKDTTAGLEWILEDKNRVWLHILFWTFIYLDEILFLLGITNYPNIRLGNTIATFAMDVLTVYFNLYILIGAYLIAGKVWMYLAFTAISIIINIEFKFLTKFNFFERDLTSLPDNAVISQLISDFAFTTFMLGTAIGAHMLRRYVRSHRKVKTLQTEKLSTELKFLKDQINPHFLFNSLNNIYVQTRTRPKQASESILLLSDLLRYQLYDCAKETVKLKNEILYLQNYLELERLRMSNSRIEFQLEGDPSGYRIAPFIFIPFVENAVKHGSRRENEFYIEILFRIIEDGKIFFRIKNAKRQKVAQIENGSEAKKSGGIGLTNVKRRLELIYPERYRLQISNNEKDYTVELTLNLNTDEMHNN